MASLFAVIGDPVRIIDCRTERQNRDRPHAGDCHKAHADCVTTDGLLHTEIQLARGTHRVSPAHPAVAEARETNRSLLQPAAGSVQRKILDSSGAAGATQRSGLNLEPHWPDRYTSIEPPCDRLATPGKGKVCCG